MINDKHCFELYPFTVAVCENSINVRHVRSFSVVVDFHYTTLTIQIFRHFEQFSTLVTSWDRPFFCFVIFISNLWWHCRSTREILTRCIAIAILIPDIVNAIQLALIGHASKQPLLLQYNVILKKDITTARCYLTPKSQTQKLIIKTNNTVRPRSNWNLRKCWFLRRGENRSIQRKTSLSKGEN